MDKMDKIESIILNLKKILKVQKYKIVEKTPKELFLKPDVLIKKNKGFEALLVRQSDSIPEVLVQRIASTKLTKNKLKIYIVFCQKPKLSLIEMVSLYGIGVKYFLKNTLVIIKQSKDFSTLKQKVLKKGMKKKKKIPQQNIFISSHQIIEERKIAEEIIKDLRDSNTWPIFPIKVEDDPRYDIKKTKNCIDRNMEDSELFLGILAEEYRPDVNYEIKKAFKIFLTKDIFIFVKSLKKRPQRLTKLIEWIKEQKNIKYLEYIDVRDFKIKLMRVLILKIKQIHKELKIPFLE